MTGTLLTLAERLQYAREKKGLNQQQLADLVGMVQQSIAAIEGGASLKPRKIDRIAKALDVSPAWLQFGTEVIDKLDSDSIMLAEAYMSLQEPFKTAVRDMILASSTKPRRRLPRKP